MHVHDHGHHDHDHHHEHEHEHEHHHHHHDDKPQITPAVLLAHTIEHNRNHLDELHKLIHQLDAETAAKAHEALEKVEEAYENFAKIFAE